MSFWIFVLTLLVLYCLYEVNGLKKETIKKKDAPQSIDKNRNFYECLNKLYGKTCEIQFSEWNIYIVGTTGTTSLRVVVEEADQEWVLLRLEKSKKSEKFLIRLDAIKDIIEISSV